LLAWTLINALHAAGQRIAALDGAFTVMQDQLFHHAGLPDEVAALRAPVGIPSQDAVVCFGRICCEHAEGKINKTNVLLEGGPQEGGRRVKLILNELPSYALFPGQFVVVEGINSSGDRMVVKKLCEGVPRPLPSTTREDLLRMHYGQVVGSQSGRPLRIMVASGPFCCTDNLDYEPLRDLLHTASKDPVDVLILTGPFVDVAHPSVAKNAVEMTSKDGSLETVDLWTLFKYKVSAMISAIYEAQPDLCLQIIIVPSLADAWHDFVFPQPPLRDCIRGGLNSPFFDDEKVFGLEIPFTPRSSPAAKPSTVKVHCVGNPSLITINEIVLGISSSDVMMNIGKEEIAQASASSNRLERLVDHLLQQQSMYPLYPATGPDSPPVDLRFSDKLRLPVSPDVMIVPSRLATFGRRLANGTLAVNPGQLAKGASGGTYAVLTVHPMPRPALDPAQAPLTDKTVHQIAERTSLQIKRI
jgi:DNA polymerase alpha subunit B